MVVSDGQIALGILQLVALTLPAFAMLTQVYFSLTERKTYFGVGFVIFAGGGLLLIAALLGAHFLWLASSSLVIEASLNFVAMGISLLGGVLYFIYSAAKEEIIDNIGEIHERSSKNKEVAKKLIEKMESGGVQTVSELRETDFEVGDDINDDLTLEELKDIKQESSEILREMDGISDMVLTPIDAAKQLRNQPKEKIKNPRAIVFIIFIGGILIVSAIPKIPINNPIGLGIVAVLGWLMPSLLNRFL